MRGKYRVVVKNKRLHYEFEIKRNITIIKGDSATGKTTLINMIRQFANLGNSSGVDLIEPKGYMDTFGIEQKDWIRH